MDSIRMTCPNCLHKIDTKVWTNNECINCGTSYSWKEQYDDENDIWLIYALWDCDSYDNTSGIISTNEISYIMNTDFD